MGEEVPDVAYSDIYHYLVKVIEPTRVLVPSPLLARIPRVSAHAFCSTR